MNPLRGLSDVIVKSFWRIVNWEDVAGRLQAVRALDLAL